MELISKNAAKLQGLSRYFTGKPCNRSHVAERYVSSTKCVECSTNSNKQYYKENIEKELIRSANYKIENHDKILKYRENNKDIINQSRLNCFNKNKDKYQKAQKEFRRLNPEKIKEYRFRHYNENKHEYIEKAKYRKISQLKRTPVWLSEDDRIAIKLIYKIAARVSKETGIDYHVDHKIPLHGKLVSGLHIPDNLQLLKASENLSKGNIFTIN